MAGIWSVLIMATLLGAASFVIGMVPLFSKVSRTRVAYLSTLGTGLLLGAALGIIIPEGVETAIKSSKSDEIPTNTIAFSLILGFAFMLVVEQLISGHDHSHGHEHVSLPLDHTNGDTGAGNGIAKTPRTSMDELDREVAELEGGLSLNSSRGTGVRLGASMEDGLNAVSAGRARAYPLTLGLVIHSLADGLALGASALPRSIGDGNEGGTPPATTQLSIVVFLALIIHKAPTALALSMSLLSTSLSRSDCKKHIAFFSASTPLGALASFGILSFLGSSAGGDWTGIALLISGGTFLYVATVLQPVSHSDNSSHSGNDMGSKTRVGLIVTGMFIPLIIGLITGHDH